MIAPVTLSAGEEFAGYTIVSPLGAGAMGEVYLAKHPRLPRREALKILRADISTDESFRQRFKREADSIADLEHPNIVTVHDRGNTDGRLWIATQYVDGADAAQLLRERHQGGMPADEVAAITASIASALDYAHGRGLLHRDVKPANILISHPDHDGNRRIYLADFGIARPLDDPAGLTATNFTFGTFAYAAPEQLMGKDIDGRADQYALAATAYHLLTGTTLFPDSNPAVVISRHLSMAPPAPSTVRPELAPFDPVFAKALAKSPEERFARCQDFANALTAAGRQVSGTPANPSPTAATQQAPVPPAEAAAAGARTQLAPVPPPVVSPPPPVESVAAAPAKAGVPRWGLGALAAAAVIVAIALGSFFALRPAQSPPTKGGSPTAGGSSPTAAAPLAVELPPAVAGSKTLRVVTNVPYTPAEFYDSQKRIVGFDVDLINAVAEELGVTAEFQNMDFKQLIPSVQQGNGDVVMAALTDTKQREAVVDLVTYYSAGTLWAQRAGTAPIDPNNACGLTVAVQTTTTQETDDLPARSQACTGAGKPPITIRSLESMDAVFNAVAGNQADALAADSPVTAYGIKASNGTLTTAGPMYDAAPYGWAVAKNSLMGPALQKALQQVMASGRYKEILDQWGLGLGAISAPQINGAIN